MLLKINKIKDFGIFQNYTWPSNTNPFKKRNLIYGWNYSGKTTFSKLFANLEKKSKIHFPSSEFTFEIERNNDTFTQDQLDTFPYFVKVFNSFYIKNILSWDKENNEGFQPILFYLGDEAGDIQPKIDNLVERWNSKIEAIIKKNESAVVSFEEYTKDNGKFSKQATIIRSLLNDEIKSNEFNKAHFIALVAEIKSDLTKNSLATNKVSEIKQQAIAINEYQKKEEVFELKESLSIIGEKVTEILQDSALKSVPFPELDNDPLLFKWVQTGLDFHKEPSKCKFCDNDLKEERINSLNQYYSIKLQEIQEAIKDVNIEITMEKALFDFEFPHESEIAKHLVTKYLHSIESYNKQKIKYNAILDIFASDLKKKEANYFNSISASIYRSLSLNMDLQSIIDVIKEHNNFVEKFEDKKKEAIGLILRHYVSEYLTSENFIIKEKEFETASKLISRCKVKIFDNNIEVNRLEGLLKNTVKGQVELNIYLKIFLNRDDIQIGIRNEKFVLLRGSHSANNLSEGEKTAIAFAYFLTELKSMKTENKLKDTIIFFDDPISSLDSNHIFQVRSLLQHFFSNKTECLQLFISTHNFEFFSVMLDSNLFKNENKADINETKCPYYLINRIADNSSVIKNLPLSLRSHKSEYAHIFSILKNYNDSSAKDTFEFKILLPNALRRFLELYTLFKYPKGYCEVDERLKMIFSPEDGVFHNTKLYHWFSHQNQFEKVAQHDSKLDLIDDAINEVIEHIKLNDKLHWSGLTGEA